jgi:hypothetical protein
VNLNPGITAQDLDKGTSKEELLVRLANLKWRAARSHPILDDDDLEGAIEEAAARLVSD